MLEAKEWFYIMPIEEGHVDKGLHDLLLWSKKVRSLLS